ncbi:MAG: stage III sporulation protein AA [Deltaproteobacteria bacterium]
MIDIETGAVDVLSRDVLPLLPQKISDCLQLLPEKIKEEIYEIRLRAGQFPSLCISKGEYLLDELVNNFIDMDKVSQEDIQDTLAVMSQNSLYAFSEEIRGGFITLKGGHRVGIVGKAVCDSNKVRNIKHFSGLNIRISRQILNSADSIIGYLIDKNTFLNTLIVSPPRCGKTTILRDLVRQLSNGIPLLGMRGQTVGLVDERSEIAACYKGVPQNQVGIRTDVLDNCPKIEGIIMLLRAMGPEIIATDEIGSLEDADAILTALYSGVNVAVTAHGSGIKDILYKPGLKKLIKTRAFNRIIVLSSRMGPGTLEAVYDGLNMKRLDIEIKDSFDSNLPEFPRRSICSRRMATGRAV